VTTSCMLTALPASLQGGEARCAPSLQDGAITPSLATCMYLPSYRSGQDGSGSGAAQLSQPYSRSRENMSFRMRVSSVFYARNHILNDISVWFR